MNILKDFDGNIDQSGKILLLDHYMGVGDALWRTCLHRELKRRNPNIKLFISSMGNYWKEMYKTNPYIDKLVDRIASPPYGEKVDYYISDKLCPHVISSYSRELDALDALEIWSGFEIRDKSYVYEVLPEEQKWAEEFLNKYSRPIVGIQLKSSTWVRTWPSEEVIRLIRMLRFNGINIVVMDNNNNFGFTENGIINMVGNSYNIREVASVIKNLNLLITPDSGLLHFGGHFKIPTIGVFGGSDPKCRLKYYSTVYPIVNKQKLDCQYCWSHSYICPKGITPSPCLSGIKAEQVFNIIKELL